MCFHCSAAHQVQRSELLSITQINIQMSSSPNSVVQTGAPAPPTGEVRYCSDREETVVRCDYKTTFKKILSLLK